MVFILDFYDGLCYDDIIKAAPKRLQHQTCRAWTALPIFHDKTEQTILRKIEDVT
ncbi:MAG: hypothetical protein RR841_10530 [Eubacterium sp.]